MDKMKIYNKLPVFLQNAACYYEGLRIKKSRYNKKFWDLLADYESRNSWTYEQLCEYRDNKLRQIVKYCYEFVPYYKRLFNDLGINFESIKTLEDLCVLPILTKQIVKDNFDDFISTDIPRSKMILLHTSGTTGSGFKFYTTNESINEQWAVWWRYRRKLGIEYDSWCALLGGRSVVPVTTTTPPFYRMNTPCKQVYFSTYHMNDNNMKSYIAELEKRKLQWIHGYPSAINLLADYIISHDIKLSNFPEFITIGAENLLPTQVEKIYSAFKVLPYQHYGLSEGTANFSHNRNRDMYVDEDFAAVEFIAQNGDQGCEVIGTSLSNYAMPLLRYRTGDIARVEYTPNGRLIKVIDGRNEDYLVLSNGTKIGRLDHIFKDIVNVKEAQIVQKQKEEVILRVVKNKNYTKVDEDMIHKEASQRLKGVNLTIEYVENIPRSSSGKLRFVISELPK